MPANPGPAPTRATIADVAQRAGVSTATVSRVINRQGHVLAGTAARVHAATAELDYFPHLSAHELAANRSHTLGLITPEIGGHFFSVMLLMRLHAHRYPLVLLHRSLPPGLAIPAVRFENKRSMYDLVDHLIVAHGRRRLALLLGLIEQQTRPQPALPTGGITLLPTSPVIRQSCGCP